MQCSNFVRVSTWWREKTYSCASVSICGKFVSPRGGYIISRTLISRFRDGNLVRVRSSLDIKKRLWYHIKGEIVLQLQFLIGHMPWRWNITSTSPICISLVYETQKNTSEDSEKLFCQTRWNETKYTIFWNFKSATSNNIEPAKRICLR